MEIATEPEDDEADMEKEGEKGRGCFWNEEGKGGRGCLLGMCQRPKQTVELKKEKKR